MKPPLAPPPVTSADISDEWLAIVRDIIERNGQAVRPSMVHPIIELKSLRDNSWAPLGLPAGGVLFTNAGERDIALRRLLAK